MVSDGITSDSTDAWILKLDQKTKNHDDTDQAIDQDGDGNYF
jgi:hypothetical protein